jgi:hypothetical protein
MDAAWNTFTTEYAKVVAGSPSGAGTLSDSARHEQHGDDEGNYSVAQKEAAFKQMQADMANRMAAIKSTDRQGLQVARRARSRIGWQGDQRPSEGRQGHRNHNGKRVIEVNGKRMVEQ